jgi:hypothetical protein
MWSSMPLHAVDDYVSMLEREPTHCLLWLAISSSAMITHADPQVGSHYYYWVTLLLLGHTTTTGSHYCIGCLKSNSVMRLATATVETSSDYC